ncbi:ABC transporter permease [Alloscardovia criceti]|uniref:ABC transporter permease n=1 Tax=Alloscardovia criceti TaxID=356828 RepID=UPI00037AE3ED|nr:ABC transporter permease [Alloscardovia criceti]
MKKQSSLMYIVRRTGLFILMLWIVSVVIFLALRVLPGDVASVIAGTNATMSKYQDIRAQLGLDKPLIVQYGEWLGNILTGNLGVSTLSGQAMSVRLASRAALTFPLIVMSMIIALVGALPLAVYSITSSHAWVRASLRALSQIVGAVPALWAGLLLILFASKGHGVLNLLPSQGFPTRVFESGQSFITALASLVLPAISVGVITAAHLMRYIRSAILDVEKSDYVTWSMAAGMTYAQAVRTTGLRLAAPQIAAVSGVSFASMITGVLTVETLFNLPGLATLFLSDVSQRDLPAVQTELLLLAAFFLIVGLIIDIIQQFLDPRLKGMNSNQQEARA